MRRIEIIDDVHLRFPGRDSEFDLRFEVGSVSVLLAQGIAPIQRDLSPEAVEQLRPIAKKFDYVLTAVDASQGMMTVTFSPWTRRSFLRVV